MKKIILAAALIAATFSAAIAGGRLTKAENDAAMKAGRKALVSKTSELEADLKQHNNDAAEAATMDILALMRQGVAQTRRDADMITGEPAKAQMKHMLGMEDIVFEYMKVMKDVPANGAKILSTAKTFQSTY